MNLTKILKSKLLGIGELGLSFVNSYKIGNSDRFDLIKKLRSSEISRNEWKDVSGDILDEMDDLKELYASLKKVIRDVRIIDAWNKRYLFYLIPIPFSKKTCYIL